MRRQRPKWLCLWTDEGNSAQKVSLPLPLCSQLPWMIPLLSHYSQTNQESLLIPLFFAWPNSNQPLHATCTILMTQTPPPSAYLLRLSHTEAFVTPTFPTGLLPTVRKWPACLQSHELLFFATATIVWKVHLALSQPRHQWFCYFNE